MIWSGLFAVGNFLYGRMGYTAALDRQLCRQRRAADPSRQETLEVNCVREMRSMKMRKMRSMKREPGRQKSEARSKKPGPGSARRRLHSNFYLLTSIFAFASLASAQETPTEREAAHDVVREMAALEKTVDASGWVERLTVSNPERDRVVARAKAAHGYRVARHGRRYHPAPGNRFPGETLGEHPHRLPEEARFRCDHGRGRPATPRSWPATKAITARPTWA